MSDDSRSRGFIPPPPSFSTAPDLSASIRPPPAPSFSSAPDVRDSYRDDSESDREQRRRKKHKRDRSRERRRSSRSPTSRRRRSRSPSKRHRRSREERSARSPTRLTDKLDTGLILVIDKYGDYDNLKYGENSASSIPTYHRSGGGRVLGLPSRYRIDTSTSKTSKSLLLTTRKQRKMLRYMDPDYAVMESDRALKRIKIKPNKTEEEPVGRLFIPLDVPGKKGSLEEEVISSGVDYRSIEGPKVKKEEEDLYEEQSDEEGGESFDEYVRRRKIEYEKQLSEDSSNPQLWLDYIAFQDESAQGLDIAGQSRFKANKGSLNEVKMSMFQKALEANPDSEDLLLAYLKLGSETWDTLTLLREWDTALKKRPESIRLWAEYINLRQTNFASFTFTQCLKVFEDCINTLNKVARRLQMKRKAAYNYQAREEIESVMVYVLLRACLFMKQSGYHERAFGTLQAQVEFSLYRPQVFEVSTEISFEDMVAEFDEFWDSEVPRFGEKDAKGWREFYKRKLDEIPSNEDVNQSSMSVDDENDEDDIILGLRDWVRIEETSERARRLPLRISTLDPELVDNDPFLVTLSDDLHGFLFSITTKEARQSLIYSIFVFLGLPFTPPGVGTNTHFCIDTFTHNNINLEHFWPTDHQVPRLITYIDGVPMEPEHNAVDDKPYNFPPSYPVGLTELFARPGQWFSCLPAEPLDCSADADFCRNAFEQLLRRDWDDHLALCYLALESKLSYKGAKNLAKRLLSDQRMNITLWNAYAQMEKSHGHIEEARKVYRTVLATYRTFPDPGQISEICHMAAVLELEQNCREDALKILISISDSKPYDPSQPVTNTQILKAIKYYEQKTAQLSLLAMSDLESKGAFHVTECLAMLQYLTQDVAAACKVYDGALEYIRERQAERGFESEQLWVSKICFLYRHAVSGQAIHRTSEMRSILEKALSLFPNNTIFIGIYVWNESRLRIMNRVRTMFARSLHEHPNIILYLSGLYGELHRSRPYDVNQVRSLFESAIEEASTRSSVLLWKLYIEHEARRGDTERTKRLFYRSLQACPWSKELCLLGIRLLTRYLSEKERHEIVSLMMEKEIRLRKEVPEALLL